MADRLIRDELLDSERYASLSSDTLRLLFVHLLLVADDLGNAEAGAPYIRRRLVFGANATDEAIAKMLSELADVDLIRVYHANNKRYVHIPRFRQRLRSYKRVCPRPPAELECNEIKALLSALSDKCRADDWQLSVTCRSLAGEEKEEKEEKEGKRRSTRTRKARETPLPEGFAISERVRAWATEKGHHRLAEHFEGFVSKARAKGYTYADWDEAFMTAIRDNWAKLVTEQKRERDWV